MRPEQSRPEYVDAESLELSALEDSTVVAAILVSPEGLILAANSKMRKLLGASSSSALRERAITELLVDSSEWSAWLSPRSRDSGVSLTTHWRAPNEATLTLRGDVRAIRRRSKHRDVLCGIFVDANEDEQLRAAIRQGARMEALGSLTAGIAHDFNNLLTVLVGNLYLVVEQVRDKPKLVERLKSARDAAKRGADLIRQLLAFARREHVEADLIDPCKVIEEVLPLLRRALGTRITLDAQLESGAGHVEASTAQLESVIVNLAINARDAIERKGTVVVKVASAWLSAEDAAQHRLQRPGAYVAMSVSDDGCGIPADALGRIFEPFFSTKTDRGGTGLGLSMVRWFAETYHGSVQVASVVGRGTTVTIWLPQAASAAPEHLDKTMPLSTLPTGSERVLVLAAEEGLLSTIRQILEVLGYVVSFAAEPEEMLAALQAGGVDLLILDASLRGDSALELLAKARAAAPELKVILATDGTSSRDRHSIDAAVLIKPFSLADLAKIVRATLDARRSPS